MSGQIDDWFIIFEMHRYWRIWILKDFNIREKKTGREKNQRS